MSRAKSIVSGRTLPPITERFWRRVNRTEECWVWTGAISANGYGAIMVGSHPFARVEGTHRVSWTLHFGPIPRGASVLHHCDNPPCVRPTHLFIGTQADNMQDMRVKNGGSAQLTPDQIRAIRREYRPVHGMLIALARKYGVNTWTIKGIVQGLVWQHIK